MLVNNETENKASLTSMPASCSRCSGRVSAIAKTQSISAGTQRPGSIGDACSAVLPSDRSKDGEGAHMYKIHNQVNPVRTLFQGTQCPCCLKEYYTATKLKAHSLHADDCRRRLIGAQVHHPPDPGTGSQQDSELARAHDRLLPPLQAAGPKRELQLLRDFETTHWPLHDACCLWWKQRTGSVCPQCSRTLSATFLFHRRAALRHWRPCAVLFKNIKKTLPLRMLGFPSC